MIKQTLLLFTLLCSALFGQATTTTVSATGGIGKNQRVINFGIGYLEPVLLWDFKCDPADLAVDPLDGPTTTSCYVKINHISKLQFPVQLGIPADLQLQPGTNVAVSSSVVTVPAGATQQTFNITRIAPPIAGLELPGRIVITAFSLPVGKEACKQKFGNVESDVICGVSLEAINPLPEPPATQ